IDNGPWLQISAIRSCALESGLNQQAFIFEKRKILPIRMLLPKITLQLPDSFLCDFFITVTHDDSSSEEYILRQGRVDVTAYKEKLKRKLLEEKNEGHHFRKLD